jgi:hypothetical protein
MSRKERGYVNDIVAGEEDTDLRKCKWRTGTLQVGTTIRKDSISVAWGANSVKISIRA